MNTKKCLYLCSVLLGLSFAPTYARKYVNPGMDHLMRNELPGILDHIRNENLRNGQLHRNSDLDIAYLLALAEFLNGAPLPPAAAVPGAQVLMNNIDNFYLQRRVNTINDENQLANAYQQALENI